ncbi:hypothetical protein ACPV3O_16805 [Vibrio rotiferianus]|jgi:hypothetical protein|uniref:hypothetical protein n=1 Tax=Vibrio rotiferianus TaxID=190895 RepID=UPI00406A4687
MKKYLAVVSVVTTMALVGCGGGGGSSSSATPTPAVKEFAHNGIYANTQDQILMVVDSKSKTSPLIVGDFETNAVLAVQSATTTEHTMTVKGVSYVDTLTQLGDSTFEATANFDSNGVTLTATINNKLENYSLAKAADSKPLNELVGTYTDTNDGTVWTIDEVGNLSVNGICQLYGKLTRSGAYYTIDRVEASNCKDADLNGVYEGVVATAEYEGKSYIAGVMANDINTIWGSVPLN